MLSQAAKAEAAEMGKSGNGNNVGMIDRDLYKEQLLRGLLNMYPTAFSGHLFLVYPGRF